MKNYIKYLTLSVLALGTLSCNESDEVADNLLENLETAAFIRTVEVISDEIVAGSPESEFSIIIEEQDEEDGGLLQNVEIFLTFDDRSLFAGDTDGAIKEEEVLFTRIEASEFTDGPFGLPRTDITFSGTDLSTVVNVNPNNLARNDRFELRLVLNLTDGRSFTNNVSSFVRNEPFFLAPFTYRITVVNP